MKRYSIITNLGYGHLLMTSPALFTDYKQALHAFRKSVIMQINKLNNTHLTLDDYLNAPQPFEYFIYEHSIDHIGIYTYSNNTTKLIRDISIKTITIR